MKDTKGCAISIQSRLIKTAKNSPCRQKIAAVALDKKGNVLGYSSNKQRFYSLHGGIHAEQRVLFKYGAKVWTIVVCRVGADGLLPIDPCKKCKKIAAKMNVTIRSLL